MDRVHTVLDAAHDLVLIDVHALQAGHAAPLEV